MGKAGGVEPSIALWLLPRIFEFSARLQLCDRILETLHNKGLDSRSHVFVCCSVFPLLVPEIYHQDVSPPQTDDEHCALLWQKIGWFVRDMSCERNDVVPPLIACSRVAGKKEEIGSSPNKGVNVDMFF